ncbi:unnamed protein product [Lota lota]
MESINYVAQLNNYVQKNNCELKYDDVGSEGPAHIKTFTQRVILNGKPYPEGVGKNKKEARQNAAKQAMSVLETDSNNSHVSGLSVRDATEPVYQPKLAQPNYVCWLNEHSQKNRVPLVVKEFTAMELGHTKPCCRFVLDGTEYPTGFGRTKKEAKEEAARLAHHEICSNAPSKTVDQSCSVESSSHQTNELNQDTSEALFSKDYDNIEGIGKGGFGQVYKARLKHLNKYYAVKIVRYKKKALREPSVLTELQHPNIVRYYSSWIEDSDDKLPNSESSSTSQSSTDASRTSLYIQMELCEAKNLKVWIDEKNTVHQDPTRGKESLDIMRQIICGVEYIHSKNLIHRDLKPLNIMVGSNGEVKIVDFGLVIAESDDDGNVLDKTMRTGTKSFMAPEQMNKNQYDQKVDIFALGLVYFQMLWNMFGHEKNEIWDGIRNQTFPEDFKRTFPKELNIIVSMLHTYPKDRPSAKEIQDKLERSDLSTGN